MECCNREAIEMPTFLKRPCMVEMNESPPGSLPQRILLRVFIEIGQNLFGKELMIDCFLSFCR
jgi:hypothetical protein